MQDNFSAISQRKLTGRGNSHAKNYRGTKRRHRCAAVDVIDRGEPERSGITLVHADTGSDESPPTQTMDDPTAPAAVTAGPTTLVYFAPSDNDANATVVVLYNTTAVTQTVVVKGYVAGGAAATWNINVGPNGVVHVVSDSVAASPPPTGPTRW